MSLWPSSSSRVDRRQIAVWLSRSDWDALEDFAERRSWSRAEVLAFLLEGLGRSSLAEAVRLDAAAKRRSGWAKPFLDPKAPSTRFGRVRLAVWLSRPLAGEVLEALRALRSREAALRVFLGASAQG